LRNTTQLRSGAVDKSIWPVFLQNASGNPTYGRFAMTDFIQHGSPTFSILRATSWYRFFWYTLQK